MMNLSLKETRGNSAQREMDFTLLSRDGEIDFRVDKNKVKVGMVEGGHS